MPFLRSHERISAHGVDDDEVQVADECDDAVRMADARTLYGLLHRCRGVVATREVVVCRAHVAAGHGRARESTVGGRKEG